MKTSSTPTPAPIASAKPWAAIHYVLQFVCRYYIATVILLYAFAKILQTQFYTTPSQLDTPVKDLTGITLAWTFFGYSYGYSLFVAAAQILSSLLLFSRRTVRLGVLLFLPIIGNILLIDYFYDIDAKPIAISLLVAALYLFLADGRAFIAYALGKPYISFEHAPAGGRWTPWERRIRWGKYVFIPLAFAGTFYLLHSLRDQFQPATPLVGIWAFPPSEQRWDRLYINSAQEAGVRSLGTGRRRKLLYDRCTIDSATRKIRIWPLSSSDDAPNTMSLPFSEFHIEGTYELSTDRKTLTIHSTDGKTLSLQNVPANHSLDFHVL